MAHDNIIATASFRVFLFVLALELSLVWGSVPASDTDKIQFALNLEFLEAEFFLHGALGYGLDSVNRSLAQGGPPPIGARKANLDPLVRRIIEEFAYQEVGHIRAIVSRVGGIPRPLLNLSAESIGRFVEIAVGVPLRPPFNPYANTINYLLISYAIPYLGLVGYVGTIPNLAHPSSRRLAASLLGVEAGQDAVIRTLLYQRANQTVPPCELTVERFTSAISRLKDELAKSGLKSEGISVPLALGAENRTTSNILSADSFSLFYARTPEEILRTLYGTGDESRPGGTFPNGFNGNIAKWFLGRRT